MKYNVLVYPAGTEIAFEIFNALRYSKFVKLYGATSVPCHAEFVFDTCVSGIPFADDPAVIDALNHIVDRYRIDFIYPAHDTALLTLTQNQDRLNAKVVTSPVETVEICRNKNKTYEFLKGADYLPKFFHDAADVDRFPVFVKPAVGQGAEGVMLVNDRWELREVMESGKEYAVCEYLPGAEFTVDCFTDKDGHLRYAGQRTRERIRSGIAVRSRAVFPVYEEVIEMAMDLNKRLKFNGAWFFQVKEDAKGFCKLMEVAPRIAGTMGLSRNRGVNLPLLTLYNMLGKDVDIIVNTDHIMLDRAFISRFETNMEYDTVYVDLDDTLITDGKVNTMLMAFLYQAQNQGKRIVLVTKNDGSYGVFRKLARVNIDPMLFNDIHYLPKDGDKADYIHRGGIFIDDSFAERLNVHEKCYIPVFDLDMVESLIDWRA